MKLLHRLLLTVASAAFFVASAQAQNNGTVANHAVAVGKGPGVSGFSGVAPGTSGLPFLSAGPSSDPAYGVLGIGGGGTGQTTRAPALNALMPTPTRAGDVPYWNGSAFATIPGNNSGLKYLTESSSGVPAWAALSTGVIYATDYLGSKTCDGVTDVTTELQNFLNAVSSNGASGQSVTGLFPSGVCLLDTASSLTFTVNTSPNTVTYNLVGNGTVLKTGSSRAIWALYIARGTYTTYEDERTNIVVSGLTIDQHNNANALGGIASERQNTRILGNIVNAGDDNGTSNQSGYSCFVLRNQPANNTDPNYGVFWSEIAHNWCKGRANPTPIGLDIIGNANHLMIHNNKFLEVSTAIQQEPMCSANTSNCASISNGVVITQNDFENFTNAVRFFNVTSLSSSQAVGWQIYGNRAENGTQFLNTIGLGLASPSPMVLGPNMLQSSVSAYVTQGATPTAIDIRDTAVTEFTFNAPALAANSTVNLGAATANGAAVGMLCDASTSNDLSGIQTTCWVSGANSISFRNTNATSAAIDLPSLTYYGRAHYPY